MKRKTLACLCSGVLTIGLIATMSFAADPEPEIANQTQPIVGISHEFAPALAGAYAGSWVMNIGGVEYPVESASAPLAFSGQQDTLGGDNATSAHLYNVANVGSLQTEDQVYVIPSPLLDFWGITGIRTIVGGDGSFLGATGLWQVNGIMHADETGAVEQVASEEGTILLN